MSLTTRERGTYTQGGGGGGGAYIWVENALLIWGAYILEGLYRAGGLIYGILRYIF